MNNLATLNKKEKLNIDNTFIKVFYDIKKMVKNSAVR